MTEDVAQARYSRVAILLHWGIAALVLFQIGLGFRMEHAAGPAKFATFQLHKSVGITILLLIALRLAWRLFRKPPALAVTGWEKTLARGVHLLFYVLLFALPLSGWLVISTSRIAVPTLLYWTIPWPHLPGFAEMSAAARLGWNEAGGELHKLLALGLVGLFALHLAGALKHHFLDRDGGIERMAPGVRAGRRFDPLLIAILLGAVGAVALGRALLPLGPSARASVNSAAAPVSEATIAGLPSEAAAPRPSDRALASPSAEAGDEVLSDWAITAGSSIRFRTRWSGEPIDGEFARFDGDIRFSPDHLDASRVEVRIHTASLASGDTQRDDTLKSAEWFASARSATALFKATRFRKTGENRYVASGTLRIKGVTLPITLPFTLRIDGDRATMQGTASIDRTAYKIGEGEYAATDEIPATVRIEVRVNARRR